MFQVPIYELQRIHCNPGITRVSVIPSVTGYLIFGKAFACRTAHSGISDDAFNCERHRFFSGSGASKGISVSALSCLPTNRELSPFVDTMAFAVPNSFLDE